MSREQVSIEFDCRRISVISHRYASNKLAVDSLTRHACLEGSLIPPKREKECLTNCFQSKICELASGKLSKSLFMHSYTHLITSSTLSDCLLVHNFQDSCSTQCH